MWSNKAKQRFKAKGVAGSDGFSEQVRGEVGRGRSSWFRDNAVGLTAASRRFLESLGEPVPEDFGGLARSVHGESVASLCANRAPIRRWADMTEAERDALRKQYEKGPQR